MDEPRYYEGTRPDYRGMELCCNCWNGAHHIRWEPASTIGHEGEMVKVITDNIHAISNCCRGGCQCPCVALANEKPKCVTKAQRKAYAEEHQLKL